MLSHSSVPPVVSTVLGRTPSLMPRFLASLLGSCIGCFGILR